MGYKKRPVVISDNEYAKAEHQIYNDLPFALDEIAPIKVKPLDEKFVKEVIIEGEQWVSLQDKPHLVLTSYSRMINTDTKTILKPAISNITVYWTTSGASSRSNRDFPKYGWEYNHEETIQRYLDMNWPLMKNGCRYLHGEAGYLFRQRTI